MQDHSHPLIDFHHPATFQGRGVAVPFTTPLLAGTRVRAAHDRGVELIVPNPSGGRGVYVLQWPGAQARCKPTVHDTMLFRQIVELPHIDPATIRAAAQAIALEGFAGGAAQAAARAAMDSDRQQRLRAHFLLLAGVCDQADPRGVKATSMAERTPDFDRWASRVLNQIASTLGRPAAELAAGLAAMGDAFAAAGIESGDHAARMPRLIDRMEQTQTALSLWLQSDPANEVGGLGRAVIKAMTSACECGATMLQRTRTVLADPMGLLKHWVGAAADVLKLAARCQWLLDGWDQVCSIWMAADTAASRRAAVLEMAQLLPVLPHEVTAWVGITISPEAMDEPCRIISHDDAWRSGSAAFALIRRNEALRASNA